MPEIESAKTTRDRAKAALSKRAPLSEDINLDKYNHSSDELPYQDDPSQLPIGLYWMTTASAQELSFRWTIP